MGRSVESRGIFRFIVFKQKMQKRRLRDIIFLIKIRRVYSYVKINFEMIPFFFGALYGAYIHWVYIKKMRKKNGERRAQFYSV